LLNFEKAPSLEMMLGRQLSRVFGETVKKSLLPPTQAAVGGHSRLLQNNSSRGPWGVVVGEPFCTSSGLSKSLIAPVSVTTRVGHASYATKASEGDAELVNFLAEEIAAEKKNQKSGALPTTFDGFSVEFNQSEINLMKKHNNEQITINLSVNHTVDSDYSEEGEGKAPSEGSPDTMRSRPNFDIDIKRGSKILTFSCSYIEEPSTSDTPQEEYQDTFAIDELSIFEGEFNDQVYAVAGDILDGYLYDLLMNMLEERGITNEFVERLSDYATDYEHRMYLNLLTQMQTFLGSK